MKTLKKFDLNNIDKSKWELFPFEKIAFRISETVDPNTTELEIYYGLEHLDAESLHIRRNGVPSDVSGGKLKCYPGDVIFGKRRAYQRKAGIVKEAGICSAHSFVFRANKEIIDVRLFPFFLHSDQFMHKMIDISVGGLSPTINWSDLKHQEFLLPPKEQHAELADLLWAMDEVIEKDLIIMDTLETLIKTKRNSLSQSGKLVALKDFIKLNYGKALKDSERVEGNFSVVSSSGIQGTHNISMVEGPGIVLGRKGNAGELIWVSNDFWVIDTAYYVTVCEDYKSYELNSVYHLLKSVDFKRDVTATAVPGLNRDDALNRYIHIPNKAQLDEFTKQIEEMENIKNDCQSKIQSSKALQKALINQLF